MYTLNLSEIRQNQTLTDVCANGCVPHSICCLEKLPTKTVSSVCCFVVCFKSINVYVK